MATAAIEDGFVEVSALPGGPERTSGAGEPNPALQALGPTGAPKRPRGRPRKRFPRPVVASGDLSDQEDIPPKRKRGRPPGTGKRQRAAKAGATSGRGSPSDKKSGSFGSNYTGGSTSEGKSLEAMTKRELQEALKTRNRRKRYIPRPAPPS